MAIINGGYREYKLDNGLKVALQNTPTQTVSGKLRVNQGTYHENQGEEGMAHFLEHCLVTGGSKKYDPFVADNIRNSFGSTNAFTNIGRTFFVGEMLSEDVGNWLDYTAEHLFNPRFDSERVNGERERVLREISDYKSNSSYIPEMEFNKLFYKGHPKGLSILGKEEVVKNADLEKLVNFHSKGFIPNNMELILVGGLPKNIEDLIKSYFSKYSIGRDTRKEFPELEPLKGIHKIHFSAPETINKDDPNGSSAIISLNYIAPKVENIESYSFSSMNHLLGGDTNSPLFQELGLKKGLAYSATTGYNGAYNAGEGQVLVKVPANRIDESIESIFDILDEMKRKNVSEEEINRLKRIIKYSTSKGLESNAGHISAIEAKLDYNLTPEMNFENWNNVSSKSIKEVANKYLPVRNGNYILYIKDPLKKE